jgi:hypothetical protein
MIVEAHAHNLPRQMGACLGRSGAGLGVIVFIKVRSTRILSVMLYLAEPRSADLSDVGLVQGTPKTCPRPQGTSLLHFRQRTTSTSISEDLPGILTLRCQWQKSLG